MNFNKHEPLARRSQSQTIEFKQIWKDDYLKTICAFANSDGSSLYLGVKDNGAICGIENYKKILETLEYPYEAIREAIINALIHRDYLDTTVLQIRVYDNKIVFSNGATLSTEVPIEKFRENHISKPFNPTIANMFYRAGFVESWGKGTNNMIDECIKSKMSESEYKYTFHSVQVIFYKTTQETKKVSTRDKIIKELEKDSSLTRNDLSILIGVSPDAIKQQLSKLKKEGIIIRIGSTKRGYWEVSNKK